MEIEKINFEINLYQRANMKIGQIASGAEYRMDKPFQNSLIVWISIVFQIEKILKICKFFKLQNSGNLWIF